MKTLSSPLQAALQSGRIVPRALVLMQFDEGAMGFWNDIGTISNGGVDYYGTGSLGTISAVAGTTAATIPNFTITLSGLDATVVNSFFEKTWHQRPVSISLGLLDSVSRDFLDDPFIIASGRMDVGTISGGVDKTSSLEISCEDISRRLSWLNPSVRSNADQLSRLSTDTFMKNVASMAEIQLYWGVKQPKPPHALKSKRGLTSPIQ